MMFSPEEFSDDYVFELSDNYIAENFTDLDQDYITYFLDDIIQETFYSVEEVHLYIEEYI